MVNERTVNSVNTLVRFCARRDIPALTRDAVQSAAGARADVAILFGGTIVAGADVLAGAMREQVASRYMIVGGQGHTTGDPRYRRFPCFPAPVRHRGREPAAARPRLPPLGRQVTGLAATAP